MATTQVDIALAKLVVQNGLSDQEQVDSLLQFQDMSDRSFGEVLVECGIVSQDQLGMLLAEARRSVQADATRVAPVRPATPSPPFGVGSPMSMSAQGGGGPAPLPLGGSRPASTPPQPARPPPAAPAAPAPRAATGAGPAVAAPAPAPRATTGQQPAAPPPAPRGTSAAPPAAPPPAAPARPAAPAPRPAPAAPAPRPATPPSAPPPPAAARKAEGLTLLRPVEMPEEPLPPPAPVDASAFDIGLEAVEEAPQLELESVPDAFDAADGMDPREEMELILRVAADMEVSDLHLHAGHRVVTRIHGALAEQPTKEFSADKVERLVLAILTEAQQQQLQKAGELDFAYTIPSGARFRANTYRHQRGLDAVFRYVPAQPPTLEHLGLPASLAGMLRWHNGLMLFTGPAGCGKTSTMAAMVALLNKDRTDNIITIEDPIEFVHPPGRSSFIQREVGGHTRSFARALRGSLREDPDVIVVGELRDLETISLALSAAETGHLVLATLHTNNAVRTINRVINAYPPEQQDQARAMLSESLRGVISQRLLPRADGEGRALALEILVVNKAAANLIRENKTLQLRTLIQTASGEGMVLLDNALLQLVKAGTITREEALRHAEETRRFESA